VHRGVVLFAVTVGIATAVLESVATSIGFGIVAMGFVASSQGVLRGWTRKEVDAEALRVTFWGGFAGMSCLCLDLIVRFLG
jgi:hypothetical protein